MDSVDIVVVGGGTVGAWAACMLAEAGRSVTLVEASTLGDGASSRAAGMVRAQGGTEAAIRLGLYSREFYRSQPEHYPLDSGFVEQGYLIPCFSGAEVSAAHERIEVQRSLGLDVEWLDADALQHRDTGLADGVALGASFAAGDGYLEPPRNVLAYSSALVMAGVDVREHCTFTGLHVERGRVVGVRTASGEIATESVLLTGGPDLAAVGRAAGGRIHAGGTRHQVVVTAPVPGTDPHDLPMLFDLASGIYWRPGENRGLMWGMSNPDEPPGAAVDFDWDYYRRMQARVAQLFPATAGLTVRRAWAATIDYTPDHLPILGPLLLHHGEPLVGTTVASAAGHGMMWGPGVSRAAADLALDGQTGLLDVTELGLDRFDADGRSRLAADPIALPFPHTT